MKKFLFVMAGIFGVLAIILYFTSLNQLDRDMARLMGTSTIVNIQGTVFCAACAIICAINVVGGIILTFIEDNATSSSSYSEPKGIRTEDGGVQLTGTNYWVCPNCKTRNPFSKIECKECGHIR